MSVRFLFLVLLFPLFFYAQQVPQPEFGKPSQEELDMTSYPKDPDADAVILYERGDIEFETVNNKVKLIKKVYRKIKILKDDAKDLATITVSTYQNKKQKEWVTKIEAATINGKQVTYILKDNYFLKARSNGIDVIFTFPNVQKGSILEYEYTIVSPFFF